MLTTFPQNSALSWERVLTTAHLVEAAGAERIWVWDHLSWHGSNFECLATVASLLAATERVSVGPGVVQLPLRDTKLLSRQISTLADMHPGRVHLGVGAGSRPEEYQRLGVGYDGRWAETESRAASLLKELGDPLRDPAVPMWVGGRSNAAQRVAGRVGGWIPAFAPPDEIAAGVDRIEQATGKRPAVALGTFIGPMGDRRAGVEWTASLYAMEFFPQHALLPDSPDGILEHMAALAAAGVGHIVINVADDDAAPTFDWLFGLLDMQPVNSGELTQGSAGQARDLAAAADGKSPTPLI